MFRLTSSRKVKGTAVGRFHLETLRYGLHHSLTIIDEVMFIIET